VKLPVVSELLFVDLVSKKNCRKSDFGTCKKNDQNSDTRILGEKWAKISHTVLGRKTRKNLPHHSWKKNAQKSPTPFLGEKRAKISHTVLGRKTRKNLPHRSWEKNAQKSDKTLLKLY